jgi:hypothetical protein
VRFFEVGKVGCFLDAVSHGLEKRRGEDVKVLTLTLRIAPFDSKLATAMPDGVKPTLFKLNSGEPKESLRRADFALGVERQILQIFAAPDTTQATRAIDQVRIHGTYARSQKDRNGFDFVFKATFGPVGRDELEFVQGWLLTQKFVTFDAAEPGMFEEQADEDEGTEADQKARTAIDGRVAPTPMWDDEPAQAADEGQQPERAHRPLHSHASKKKRMAKAPSKPEKRGRR